jgi:hypothetical protein
LLLTFDYWLGFYDGKSRGYVILFRDSLSWISAWWGLQRDEEMAKVFQIRHLAMLIPRSY